MSGWWLKGWQCTKNIDSPQNGGIWLVPVLQKNQIKF